MVWFYSAPFIEEMESHIICGFFDIPQDVGHKKGI
jgi:hypothetical protein